ncbi:phosphodiester glycosidase family protein [Desulfitobacterium hafniense]|uniref:phosphodiester glycosidase family protein n=1 Tax=Desulfitobacterium hafniense TaxID=49338 RepID=UPI000AAE7A1B|nr:phosphodiester glycosidase family protein [Desulfitobacterium hafniense]
MKRLRKIPALFLAALLSVTALPNTAMAQLPVLYQDHSQQTVTDGVTLENISRFTTGGWLNINVLHVDMNNPYVKIDTLSNDSITDDLVSISALAEKEGAVAAVNSSFFNPFTAGKGYADGPTVRAGDLLSTSAWYNRSKNEMASLSVDYANQLLFHYWKNDLTLITGNDTAFAVTQYNQPSRQDYQDLTVLDRKWGPVAIGASENCPDLVEIVVSGNKILEIREGQPAAEIPEEGFVIVSRGEQAAKLLEQAAPGEQLQFQVTSSPDWNDLKMSTTGTSLLVQDGKIPNPFSYSTPSFNQRNPRTMAGSTEDGSELLLVTVDGRQDNSIGLTQQESAELMLELGAYQAITRV